jgi:hypothetical protein
MKKAMIGLFALMMVVSVNAAAIEWAAWGYVNGSPTADNFNNYNSGQVYLLLVNNIGTFGVTDNAGVLSITGATIVNSNDLRD